MLTPLLFLGPSLIGVIGFLAVPIVLVFALSTVQWDLLDTPHFVGLQNFVTIFEYDKMGRTLFITLCYVLLNIPLQTALALGLALLLNRSLPGIGFIRVLAVLPFLSTPVAMALVWNWFFNPADGAINEALSLVGIQGPAWLASETWALPVVALVNIWQYVGYNMLFFLAGLRAVPKELYEAASLDGAGRVQQFRRITLPMLRPTMLFVLVTGIIGSFQVFDTVYALTKGGPGDSTTVVNQKIYTMAFTGFRIGEASAMSVVLFAVILAVTLAQFAYFRRRTVYGTN